MKGGEKNDIPQVIVKNYTKSSLEKLEQRRLELIASIVYRVLSNKE